MTIAPNHSGTPSRSLFEVSFTSSFTSGIIHGAIHGRRLPLIPTVRFLAGFLAFLDGMGIGDHPSGHPGVTDGDNWRSSLAGLTIPRHESENESQDESNSILNFGFMRSGRCQSIAFHLQTSIWHSRETSTSGYDGTCCFKQAAPDSC